MEIGTVQVVNPRTTRFGVRANGVQIPGLAIGGNLLTPANEYHDQIPDDYRGDHVQSKYYDASDLLELFSPIRDFRREVLGQSRSPAEDFLFELRPALKRIFQRFEMAYYRINRDSGIREPLGRLYHRFEELAQSPYSAEGLPELLSALQDVQAQTQQLRNSGEPRNDVQEILGEALDDLKELIERGNNILRSPDAEDPLTHFVTASIGRVWGQAMRVTYAVLKTISPKGHFKNRMAARYSRVGAWGSDRRRHWVQEKVASVVEAILFGRESWAAWFEKAHGVIPGDEDGSLLTERQKAARRIWNAGRLAFWSTFDILEATIPNLVRPEIITPLYVLRHPIIIATALWNAYQANYRQHCLYNRAYRNDGAVLTARKDTTAQPSIHPLVLKRLNNRPRDFQRRFMAIRDVLDSHTSLSTTPNPTDAIVQSKDPRLDTQLPLLRDLLAYEMAIYHYMPQVGDVIEVDHRTDGETGAYMRPLGVNKVLIAVDLDRITSDARITKALISEVSHAVDELVLSTLGYASTDADSQERSLAVDDRITEVLDMSRRVQYGDEGLHGVLKTARAEKNMVFGLGVMTRFFKTSVHQRAVDVAASIFRVTQKASRDPKRQEKIFGLAMVFVNFVRTAEHLLPDYAQLIGRIPQLEMRFNAIHSAFQQIQTEEDWLKRRNLTVQQLQWVIDAIKDRLTKTLSERPLFREAGPQSDEIVRFAVSATFRQLDNAVNELGYTRNIQALRANELVEWFNNEEGQTDVLDFMFHFLNPNDAVAQLIDAEFESIKTPDDLLVALQFALADVEGRVLSDDARATTILSGLRVDLGTGAKIKIIKENNRGTTSKSIVADLAQVSPIDKFIEALPLTVRAINDLRSAGVASIEELRHWPTTDVSELQKTYKKMKLRSILEIRDVMGAQPLERDSDVGISSTHEVGLATRDEHEAYHQAGDFAEVIKSIALEIGATPRSDGRYDLRAKVRAAGRRIVLANGKGELRLEPDGALVIIHQDFKKDHAGRGEFAAYARSEVKAQHELAEVRAWAQFALDRKLLTQQELMDGFLGQRLRAWINDPTLPKDRQKQRYAETEKLAEEFHQKGLEAEFQFVIGNTLDQRSQSQRSDKASEQQRYMKEFIANLPGAQIEKIGAGPDKTTLFRIVTQNGIGVVIALQLNSGGIPLLAVRLAADSMERNDTNGPTYQIMPRPHSRAFTDPIRDFIRRQHTSSSAIPDHSDSWKTHVFFSFMNPFFTKQKLMDMYKSIPILRTLLNRMDINLLGFSKRNPFDYVILQPTTQMKGAGAYANGFQIATSRETLIENPDFIQEAVVHEITHQMLKNIPDDRLVELREVFRTLREAIVKRPLYMNSGPREQDEEFITFSVQALSAGRDYVTMDGITRIPITDDMRNALIGLGVLDSPAPSGSRNLLSSYGKLDVVIASNGGSSNAGTAHSRELADILESIIREAHSTPGKTAFSSARRLNEFLRLFNSEEIVKMFTSVSHWDDFSDHAVATVISLGQNHEVRARVSWNDYAAGWRISFSSNRLPMGNDSIVFLPHLLGVYPAIEELGLLLRRHMPQDEQDHQAQFQNVFTIIDNNLSQLYNDPELQSFIDRDVLDGLFGEAQVLKREAQKTAPIDWANLNDRADELFSRINNFWVEVTEQAEDAAEAASEARARAEEARRRESQRGQNARSDQAPPRDGRTPLTLSGAYELLQLDRTSLIDLLANHQIDLFKKTVKGAYRALALKWHPDRATSEIERTEATAKMVQINLAFEKVKGDLESEARRITGDRVTLGEFRSSGLNIADIFQEVEEELAKEGNSAAQPPTTRNPNSLIYRGLRYAKNKGSINWSESWINGLGMAGAVAESILFVTLGHHLAPLYLAGILASWIAIEMSLLYSEISLARGKPTWKEMAWLTTKKLPSFIPYILSPSYLQAAPLHLITDAWQILRQSRSLHARRMAKLVRADLVVSVQAMFDAGPNRWVKLPHESKGKYDYQRGVRGGLAEAFRLLSGAPEPGPRHAISSRDDRVGPSDTFLDRMVDHSGSYSLPLTVRGRVEHFHDEERFVTTLLPAGNTINTVEAIGTFLPEPQDAIAWASNYLKMRNRLADAGMSFDPNSRGARFAESLQEALGLKSPDSYNKLISIFNEYRSDINHAAQPPAGQDNTALLQGRTPLVPSGMSRVGVATSLIVHFMAFAILWVFAHVAPASMTVKQLRERYDVQWVPKSEPVEKSATPVPYLFNNSAAGDAQSSASAQNIPVESLRGSRKVLNFTTGIPIAAIDRSTGKLLFQQNIGRIGNSKIYLKVFETSSAQDAAVSRASEFVEGRGKYDAYDFRATDLARFYNAQQLNAPEADFRDELLARGLVIREPSGQYKGKDVAVITITRGSGDLHNAQLSHEVVHGIYFTEPAYRASVERIFNHLSPKAQQAVKEWLLAKGYKNVLTDRDLLLTEFASYFRDWEILVRTQELTGSNNLNKVLDELGKASEQLVKIEEPFVTKEWRHDHAVGPKITLVTEADASARIVSPLVVVQCVVHIFLEGGK